MFADAYYILLFSSHAVLRWGMFTVTFLDATHFVRKPVVFHCTLSILEQSNFLCMHVHACIHPCIRACMNAYIQCNDLLFSAGLALGLHACPLVGTGHSNVGHAEEMYETWVTDACKLMKQNNDITYHMQHKLAVVAVEVKVTEPNRNTREKHVPWIQECNLTTNIMHVIPSDQGIKNSPTDNSTTSLPLQLRGPFAPRPWQLAPLGHLFVPWGGDPQQILVVIECYHLSRRGFDELRLRIQKIWQQKTAFEFFAFLWEFRWGPWTSFQSSCSTRLGRSGTENIGELFRI